MSINKVSSFFSEEWFPASVVAQKLNILTSEFRRYETIHVYSEDPQVMLNYELAMKELAHKIDALTEEYKHVAQPEAKATAQDLDERWRRYMAANERVVKLSRGLQTNAAVNMLMGDSRDRYNEYNLILGEIVNHNMVQAARAGEEGRQRFNHSWNMISLILALALALAVGIGWAIVRVTLRHLGKDPAQLSVLARKVAEGELNLQDDPEARGVYADILGMARRLGEQIQSLETLTSNIPGGVKNCLMDEGLTITWMSTGFLGMVGYSREELAEQFHSQYKLLVLPEDWNKQTLTAQLEQSDTFEWEHRLMCKDGGYIWVLDKGRRVHTPGGDQLFCVILDISELVLTRERLKSQEEQCLAALCATNNYVFESDPLFSFVLHKGKESWLTLYGRLATSYADAFNQTASLCHPDDIDPFESVFAPEALLRKINEGAENVRLEYRVFNNKNERYVWEACTLVPFTDVNGKLIKLFGCIMDIDERKQHERTMLDSARKDSLTGMYNKRFAEEEIAWMLSQAEAGSHHALFVVDIDNFKAVNDNLGHLFGDAVLVDVAARIRKTFRSTDVTGRIGGDEFVILVRDVASEELLRIKAEELCQSLRRNFAGKDCEYAISGSVGVALYPQDGVNYRELFQKADTALYAVKHKGKGNFSLYSPEATLARSGEGLTAMARRAESRSIKEDVISYIFELFYEAKDIKTIVNIALGMIGQHYEVSRAHVYFKDKNANDGAFFEWCNSDAPQQNVQIDARPYMEIEDYTQCYASDGTFACDNILQLPQELREVMASRHVHSCLHVGIFDKDGITGYVGFEQCNEHSKLTTENAATLSAVAKIIGIFLQKDAISRRLTEAHENVRSVLDGLNIWAYVIDPESHTMIFLNHNARLLLPGVMVGVTTCHAALFNGCSTVCEFCPLLDMKPEDSFHTKEIYNPYLNLWMLVTASRIVWSGKPAMLMCCLDVTDYKKPGGLGKKSASLSGH